MSGHDPERALVQSLLDARAARLADARESMQAELDHLRESWSSGADLADGHQDRMQAMRAETVAWIRSNFVDGEASEPAPTQDVAGAEGASVPGGHRPQQPTPHEAELQRAREIHDMDMRTYAARRAELGVQSPTSMNKLFS